ncbi:MAG TPA: hypothetical protein PLW86_11150 [Rhodocyclaceae bacterium]|nr:hypothetical protein [Rhodocyclaceae bacterium]
MKLLLSLVVVLMALMPSTDAQAHRNRVHWGVSIGVPLYWQPASPYRYYPYYSYPYYSYPYSSPVVVLPPAPAPVYVEQNPPRPVTESRLPAGYWYYCPSARAYYPYVRECAEAWQPVSPTPPASEQR